MTTTAIEQEPTPAPAPATTDGAEQTWCFAHMRQHDVKRLEALLTADERFRFFVHKREVTVSGEDGKPLKEKEVYTVHGLIFIQGAPAEVQAYFSENFLPYRLGADCSTGLPAVIPHRQMVPFMLLLQTDADRLRSLSNPLEVYARDNVKVRIASGMLRGLEGYIVRLHRDRCLVMDMAGHTVAVSNVHKE